MYRGVCVFVYLTSPPPPPAPHSPSPWCADDKDGYVGKAEFARHWNGFVLGNAPVKSSQGFDGDDWCSVFLRMKRSEADVRNTCRLQ